LLSIPIITIKLYPKIDSLAIKTHMYCTTASSCVQSERVNNSWGGFRSPGKHMSVKQNENETNVIMKSYLTDQSSTPSVHMVRF